MTRTAVFASAPLLALASMAVSNPPEPTLADVLQKAAEYVVSYQEELGSIIAEESYVQEVYTETVPNASQRFGAPSVTRTGRRHLLSDFLMLRLPQSTEAWLGFRDVFEVDGRAVRARADRFAELLSGAQENAILSWRKLANESARFNLGPVYRDFNVPTFALRALLPEHQRRFRFTKRGEDTIEGTRAWIIGFREVDGPTLVIDHRKRAVFTRGRFWVQSSNGHVVRTEIVVPGPGGSESRNEVRYRPDDRLGIWVAVEMRDRSSAGRTTMQGTAQYSNFRRFEVAVKLLIPPTSD